MTKKPKTAKNEQHREIITRYAERRAELKRIIKPPHSIDRERMDAQYKLSHQPHGTSPTHVRNRDTTDGRPCGYLRRFGLPRVCVREMIHRNEFPSVRESSQ